MVVKTEVRVPILIALGLLYFNIFLVGLVVVLVQWWRSSLSGGGRVFVVVLR